MKALCDVCGGALLIESGGECAVCTVCGMKHSIQRVREKLGVSASPVNEVKQEANTEIFGANYPQNNSGKDASYYTKDYSEEELAKLEGRVGEYQWTNEATEDELQRTFAQYFSDGIFSSYTIEQYVSADTFGASPKCVPINFLFKKDGKPVLGVVIIRKKSAVSHGAVTGTKDALLGNDIKYLKFFTQMPNNEFYVRRKVLKELGF